MKHVPTPAPAVKPDYRRTTSGERDLVLSSLRSCRNKIASYHKHRAEPASPSDKSRSTVLVPLRGSGMRGCSTICRHLVRRCRHELEFTRLEKGQRGVPREPSKAASSPRRTEIDDDIASSDDHVTRPAPAKPNGGARVPSLDSTKASAYAIRGITWFWPGRFALGKLGLIGGLPDKGKGLDQRGHDCQVHYRRRVALR